MHPGNEDIGKLPAWLDELFVHGTNGELILFSDRCDRAATFLNVAKGSAKKSEVRRCIDEDFQPQPVADLGNGEQQDAFHEQYRSRLDFDDGRDAMMCPEVVDGLLNGPAGEQRIEVLDEQLIIECFRMVPVACSAGESRQEAEIFVVGVVTEMADMGSEWSIQEPLHDCGLSGTAASGDSRNNDRSEHSLVGSISFIRLAATAAANWGGVKAEL